MSDKKYKDMTKAELMSAIDDIIPEDLNGKLPWTTLCKYTEFDSFSTAFAFGINWQNTNMKTMLKRNLSMAHYNLTHFPKEKTRQEAVNE